MIQKSPPRYVPTLTQVVATKPPGPAPANALLQSASSVPSETKQLTADDLAQLLRQQLLVRTRQYIDIELQRRIREAVSQLALAHAQKLFEELQPQLESTICQVVDEAVAQAVAHAAANAP